MEEQKNHAAKFLAEFQTHKILRWSQIVVVLDIKFWGSSQQIFSLV